VKPRGPTELKLDPRAATAVRSPSNVNHPHRGRNAGDVPAPASACRRPFTVRSTPPPAIFEQSLSGAAAPQSRFASHNSSAPSTRLFPEGRRSTITTRWSSHRAERTRRRKFEPRNGDSHLTFQSAPALRNCVTYQTRPDAAGLFCRSGRHPATPSPPPSARTTTVVAYDPRSASWGGATSVRISGPRKHPIELGEPRGSAASGLLDRVNEDCSPRGGLERGGVSGPAGRAERGATTSANHRQTSTRRC